MARISEAHARKLGLVPKKARSKSKVTVISSRLFQEACKSQGFEEPIPEFKFCPDRDYRCDWCFPESKVILEIEGAIHGTGKPCPVCKRRAPGGHSSVVGIKRDMDKYNIAAELGYRVVRCLPSDMNSGAVFALLKRMMP